MKTIFGIFVRLNNRSKRVNASTFAKAGYPMAIPAEGEWSAIHAWCHQTFRDYHGRVTYCWTGEKFWFQNESDRQKFVDRFGNHVP